MKIERVNLVNHPFFGDRKISFIDSNDNILDVIVFAGNNGSGKTTILKTMFDILTDEKNNYDKCYLKVTSNKGLGHPRDTLLMLKNLGKEENNKNIIYQYNFNLNHVEYLSTVNKIIDNNDIQKPKIVYMPSDISFEKLSITEKNYEYEYKFRNIVDRELVKDVPNYLSSLIIDSLIKNEDLTAKEATEIVCNEINDIFSILEIDAKMTGLKKDGEKIPLFKNSKGKEFDINGLSSGEKQLFLRALSLKMLNVNNSIILIDEPEISLHPKWQQKILKVYTSIGNNNQVIVATHSPHVVSSVPRESVFLLSTDENGANILNYNDLGTFYGKPISIVLTDFMGLNSDRAPEISEKIKKLQIMINNDKYESDEFKTLYGETESIVGNYDQEIILINMDIARRKAAKVN